MHNDQTLKLVLTLPVYQGVNVGFFHSGGETVIRGWWQRSNKSEGGELVIDAKDSTVLDYDGCYELPDYIYEELNKLGIKPATL